MEIHRKRALEHKESTLGAQHQGVPGRALRARQQLPGAAGAPEGHPGDVRGPRRNTQEVTEDAPGGHPGGPSTSQKATQEHPWATKAQGTQKCHSPSKNAIVVKTFIIFSRSEPQHISFENVKKITNCFQHFSVWSPEAPPWQPSGARITREKLIVQALFQVTFSLTKMQLLFRHSSCFEMSGLKTRATARLFLKMLKDHLFLMTVSGSTEAPLATLQRPYHMREPHSANIFW